MKTLLFPLPTDINDIQYASGSFLSIYKSLSKLFNIIPVGPLKLEKFLLYGMLNKLNDYHLFPWRFASMHSWKTIDGYGKQLQTFIDSNEFDAVFATSTLHAAKIRIDKPVFAFTDLSFINALDYYKFASRLFPSSKKEALAVDKFCFERYTKVFLASEWAKTATVEAYGIDPDKIQVVGRGANMTSEFSNKDLNDNIDSRIKASKKIFLFIGSNWEHKGGDTAFKIVNSLREKGINVKLNVVGCLPPSNVLKYNFVEVHRYLSRNKQEDLKIFKNLFTESFLFIMPTRSDAMGISFNEASSFGLPSISYNTGGVGSAVENNVTGMLFDQSDSIDTMVTKIIALIKDTKTYRDMALHAFNKFKYENNWDAIALKIKKEIEPLM